MTIDLDQVERSVKSGRLLDDGTILALIRRVREAEKDAARYRWLRHGDNDELVMRSYTVRIQGHDQFLPRNENLDSAIDAELAKESNK